MLVSNYTKPEVELFGLPRPPATHTDQFDTSTTIIKCAMAKSPIIAHVKLFCCISQKLLVLEQKGA